MKLILKRLINLCLFVGCQFPFESNKSKDIEDQNLLKSIVIILMIEDIKLRCYQ